MKKISCKILFIVQIIFFIQTNLDAQTLTTDKPDYPPGDTAIITGTGFQPGEIVTMQVLHAVADSIPDTGQDHFQWYVAVDSLGNFTTKWHVCEDDCLGANLVANADGNSSGRHAEVYFTDALKTDTYPSSFSAFAGTFSYCQNAIAANLSAAWSNTTCNGISNGGNTNIPITITWYKNSINSTSGGTAVQTTNSNAGTTSSAYTPSTNIAGTFYYYTVISWTAGSNCAAAGSMTTTTTKTVVVNPTPATPTISANGPVAFCQGGSVVLSSSSSSGNQWYNNSGLLAGETNQNLTAITSGSYSVIVTIGSCSSAPSVPVSVTVNPYPTGGVSILSPNPSTICSGSSTTLKFSGTANASLSYNKNGILQSPLALNNGGLSNLSTGPLTSNTSYEVVSVTSNGCTTTSGFSPASLTVTVNQPPVVTGQPVNQTVTYGAPANFIVTATGDGLTYQWQENAGLGFVNISNLTNVYSGVTTATLNVERPTVAMNGYRYRVIVSGICAPTATSSEAILSVNKASLTVTADDKNKIYGKADPALTYTTSGTLYYGDSYSVITGVSLSTATGSAATTGTHAIVPAGGIAANYDIGYVNGILTVSLRPVTVTADALSKVYGDADPALTYQVTSGSLVYADVFTGA
ncbi:MAG: MBG domain-containing protein, partial [Bacteroidia bacterium]